MVQGEMQIGSETRRGSGAVFYAFNPATGERLQPDYFSATAADVDHACTLAAGAFVTFSNTSPQIRADFLEAIAASLEAMGEEIVPRAVAETGLPEGRIRNELGRTTGQLRLFAGVLRDGAYLDVRIDSALPERAPPRSDIRLVHRPLGPVAVFGASNFPLAFSVAGGDTAAALAAGCPVVVKAHPAHPGTSELAGRAIQQAVDACNLPEGVFSLLFDSGIEIGKALVSNPHIQAAGFTGSRKAGFALMALAAARPQPIPVFAEMSSINPVILLPGALAERGEAIGRAFAAALTLGGGQFCTNPGLVLALDGSRIDNFVEGARRAVADMAPATMLTAGIHDAYRTGVEALREHPKVKHMIEGVAGTGPVSQPNLFGTHAENLLADARLTNEVFGASSVLATCRDTSQLHGVIDQIEGQLTISVHAAASDLDIAGALMARLERKAGRVLFNGFGTGVEVCDAMVHGGPFPATSDGRSTSVGSLAIKRFLRPVCYQDVPTDLLPQALRDENPFALPRCIDGIRT